MPKIRCKGCGSRPRLQNALVFGSLELCHDCHAEYSKIFYGYANREKRRRKEVNPLFRAFKNGWTSYEEKRGLHPKKISAELEMEYDRVWENSKNALVNDEVELKILIAEIDEHGHHTRMMDFWHEEGLSQEDTYGSSN